MTFLFVVATLLVLLISIAISQLSAACLGAASGGKVEEVSVGAGPALWSCIIQGITFKIGVLPIGGYTRFLNRESNPEEAIEERAAVLREDEIPFEELPILARFLIIGLGPLSFLIVGIVLFVIAQSLPNSDVLINHSAQFPIRPCAVPGLSVNPQSTSAGSQAQLLMNTSLEFFWRVISMQSLQGWGGIIGMIATCAGAGVLSTGAWFSCMGAVIFGFGLINLIPLPIFAGGHLVFLVCEAVGRKPSEGTFTAAIYASLVLLMTIAVRIIYADVMWLRL